MYEQNTKKMEGRIKRLDEFDIRCVIFVRGNGTNVSTSKPEEVKRLTQGLKDISQEKIDENRRKNIEVGNV